MTIKPLRQSRGAGLSLLIAAAMALGAAPAHAVVIKNIKKCETISKPGLYQLANDLSFAGPDVCLRITGNKVILDLEGHTLMGSGAGTGIQIMGKNVFIDGKDANITGFGIGIEDDGDNAVVENFGLQMNTDTGLYVNGANGSTFGGFGTGNNTNHGIHLRRADHNLFITSGSVPTTGNWASGRSCRATTSSVIFRPTATASRASTSDAPRPDPPAEGWDARVATARRMSS